MGLFPRLRVGATAPTPPSHLLQPFIMDKTEVRIVAGTLKGRKLSVVVHEGLRPTPQMVREALFSILGDAVPDRVFYDVFAGTGVVGLEAVRSSDSAEISGARWSVGPRHSGQASSIPA